MADYVPSAIIVGGAVITVGVLASIRAPLLLIMLVAIFSLMLVVTQHKDLFAADYRTAKTLDLFAGWAPFIIVGVVILMSLFYIFFLRGLGSSSSSSPTYSSPPANIFASSTTTLTNAAKNLVPRNTIGPARNNLGLNSMENRNRAEFLSALERAV